MRSSSLALAASVVCALSAGGARAASSNPTSTTNLLRANGSGEILDSGDWVTDAQAPGLDNAYRFFIEVPPGTPQLVVEVFDPDVGRGGNNEGTRDLLTGRSWNTAVIYTLLDPSGAQVAPTVTCSNATTPAVCVDNAWSALFGTVTNPTPGHWQLVVDPSDANRQNGDETVGYGVRAHDGNPGTGGVELNVYADSYLGLGPTTANSQANQLFPWVTAGCFARSNDFDSDTSNGTSYGLVGNVGFSQTFTTVSGSGVWRANASSNFTTDDSAQNYGVWTASATITKPGGAAANMMTYYVSSPFSAVAGTGNNPQSQPGEPGAFRLYLPTDGGGVPQKPFVEQFVRFAGGANPPQPGQTTTLSITVVVHNPATLPITFSAARTVTTTVPAPALFAGSAAATQGTVVSQPAVGGIGNVVWNPGAVAAGQTALLTYKVTVTPSTSGQRIVVTGAGQNGTTAIYLDETGAAAQARATYTFGPLCELAVTAGTVTYAPVVDVRGTRDAGGVRVSWRTAGEAGTAGFTVSRVGARGGLVDVGGSLLGSMTGAGASYATLDDDAPAGPLRYVITEHDLRGGIHRYGPFAVLGPPSPPSLPTLPVVPLLPGTPVPAAPAVAAPPRLVLHTLDHGDHGGDHGDNHGQTPAAPARLRIRVDDDGLAGVSVAQIAALLQRPVFAVSAAAEAHALRLSHDGQPWPWALAGDTVVFRGAKETRPFGAEGTFFLRLGHDDDHGGAPASENAAPGVRAPNVTSARAVEHVERDVFAATAVDLDPFGDIWFWAAFLAGVPSYAHFETAVPVPADDGAPGTITVALQGASSSGVPGEHVARVSVDGVVVGDIAFSGIERATGTFAVPPGAVVDGALDVAVDAVDTHARGFNVFYLDSIEVEHERSLDASAPTAVPVRQNDVVAVSGLDEDGLLYELEGERLVRLKNARVVEGAARGRVRDDGTLLFAEAPAAPLSVEAVPDAGDLESGAAAAVIVAPRALADGAAALSAWHAERGLVDRVVFVDDLFDRYAAGARDPRAIQRFLTVARERWQQPPSFVVLLGDGDVDYRDVEGLHENLVPPLLVRTSQGLAAADGALADVDGDGLADLAFGRIPARTVDEVNAYVARARAFTGPSRALFAADDAEAGADFPASAAGLAQQLSIPTGVVALQPGALASTRAALFAGLDQGAQLFTWVGHGGLDRLASEGVVTTSDAPAFLARQPVVVDAFTCIINRFETVGFPGLGEVLVRDGGAPAVIAPSAVSVHAHAEELGAHFEDGLRAGGPLGRILVGALHGFVDAGGDRELAGAENLLGDPTLPVAAEAGPASCASSGGSPWALLVLGAALFLGRRRADGTRRK